MEQGQVVPTLEPFTNRAIYGQNNEIASNFLPSLVAAFEDNSRRLVFHRRRQANDFDPSNIAKAETLTYQMQMGLLSPRRLERPIWS